VRERRGALELRRKTGMGLGKCERDEERDLE